MRKLFILFVAVIAVTTVSAQQKGDVALGVKASLGVAGDGAFIEALGCGVKLQWNAARMFRIEPSFTYCVNDGLYNWDASLNLHYQFALAKNFAVYPLVGLCYTNFGEYEYDYDEPISEFGGNFGVGIDYNISRKWILNVEAVYKVTGWSNDLIASVGVAYKF